MVSRVWLKDFTEIAQPRAIDLWSRFANAKRRALHESHYNPKLLEFPIANSLSQTS
ncbi:MULTISPECIES: hypothetical protein [unclassified Moorena]|uniref:hypothetical protein n=1 Tax=unclassified Moorena TaxID=2683338 RepID=UPI0013FEB831|nr:MULTISPECIES: hypothetical protein [unclassified Moorena]NEO11656.1 hypothetical protein [Moorena sp. SIO3E8]NEQ01195.1 hypothetical protein [Moorena sp. SIO3F7]